MGLASGGFAPHKIIDGGIGDGGIGDGGIGDGGIGDGGIGGGDIGGGIGGLPIIVGGGTGLLGIGLFGKMIPPVVVIEVGCVTSNFVGKKIPFPIVAVEVVFVVGNFVGKMIPTPSIVDVEDFLPVVPKKDDKKP